MQKNPKLFLFCFGKSLLVMDKIDEAEKYVPKDLMQERPLSDYVYAIRIETVSYTHLRGFGGQLAPAMVRPPLSASCAACRCRCRVPRPPPGWAAPAR